MALEFEDDDLRRPLSSAMHIVPSPRDSAPHRLSPLSPSLSSTAITQPETLFPLP